MFRRLGHLGPLLQRSYAVTKSANKTKSESSSESATKLLVSCKHKKFNLSQEAKLRNNAKFGTIELASSGWKHHKAKGDYFVIHPRHLDERINISPNSDPKSSDASNAEVHFTNLGLDERIVRNLEKNLNVTQCTYVQHEGIPQILAGDHALIAAETGCGKTLSYLVPIIQQILQNKSQEAAAQESNNKYLNLNTPLALVLTPGRELATQIGEVAEKVCDGLDISISVLLGGRTKRKMLDPTLEDVDILIGTMGATSKLVTTGIFRMHKCQYVVLDEADTLLDDSFIPKLAHFLKRFPFYKNHMADSGAQLIMASATMPTNTTELLQNIIDPTTMHEVVSSDLHRLVPHIEQRFVRMNRTGRPVELLRLVRDDLEKRRPIIVFCNKSATSDYVSMFLNENGVGCVNLNGDMAAALRIGQFEKFQTGQVDVLATTDMASRGLDTIRSRHIINFDFPLHMADYIHRIGRTGRLGSHERCLVTNFVSSEREIDLVQRIEHTARTLGVLPKVNANITNIIKNRILRGMNEDINDLTG